MNPSTEFDVPRYDANFAEERRSVLESLKTDINTFLWTRLPPFITMGDADDLAEKIFDIIEGEWLK